MDWMTGLLPGPTALAVCAAAVLLGTVVQRLTGQGFGMVAAPVLALAAPGWLPGTVLLIGLAVGAGSVLGVRGAVALRDLPPGFAGRTLGAVLAAWIAARVVGTSGLPLAIGLIVWLAVLLSVAGLRLPIRPATLFGAGAVAGVMGTLTGIGAPPMAILYSGVEARRSAATQNAFFAFGMAVSLLSLTVAGVMGLRHLAFAAVLAPLVPLALWLSRPLAARVEGGTIRPWALGLAACAASVLVWRGLTGG